MHLVQAHADIKAMRKRVEVVEAELSGLETNLAEGQAKLSNGAFLSTRC